MVDVSQIQTAIGLASGALGATGQAVSTVEAIKGLFAKGEKATPKGADDLINTLAAQLTAANLMNVQLSEALRSLGNSLQKKDAFELERARYEVFHTPESDIVLRLRDDASHGEQTRFACPVCIETDRIFAFVTGSGGSRFCQKCGKHFLFQRDTAPRTSRRGPWM